MFKNRKIFISITFILLLSGCFDSVEEMSVDETKTQQIVQKKIIIKENSRKTQKQLFIAIRKGSIKRVEKLIKDGVNINQKSLKGVSPLHLASGLHNVEMVELLLKYEADPEMKNKFGLKPIAYVKNKAIFKILEKVTPFKRDDPSYARVYCSLFVWKDKNIAKQSDCIIAGKYYLDHEAYWQSAWLYLVGGDFKLSIKANQLSQKYNSKDDIRASKTLGHAYLLNGDYGKAKQSYSYFYLKEERSNAIMKKNYMFLDRLFKDKIANIKKGREIWKDIAGESI